MQTQQGRPSDPAEPCNANLRRLDRVTDGDVSGTRACAGWAAIEALVTQTVSQRAHGLEAAPAAADLDRAHLDIAKAGLRVMG